MTVLQQLIVGYLGKVIEFQIVQEYGKPFLDVLVNQMAENKCALTCPLEVNGTHHQQYKGS